MKLKLLERVKLLEALPKQEDILTIKILRKMKETLSFSEEELKSFDVSYEYGCPFRSTDSNGKMEICLNKGLFREQPTCGKHDLAMVQTGIMNVIIPPESQDIEKEIHLGTKALAIASDALKRLNSSKLITEAHESLWDKFFPPDEEEKD